MLCLVVYLPLDSHPVPYAVLKIRAGSWSVIPNQEHYYRLSTSPLEMYSKFVLPNWTAWSYADL